jgi:hypothetical protein
MAQNDKPYQSTDAQSEPGIRDSRDIYAAFYPNPTPSVPIPAFGASKFQKIFTIDLTAAGIGSGIVDIDVWYYDPQSGGGGTTDYNHIKLPFHRMLSDGTVWTSCFYSVFVNGITSPAGTSVGNTQLSITYTSFSSSADVNFYYKVSTRTVTTL